MARFTVVISSYHHRLELSPRSPVFIASSDRYRTVKFIYMARFYRWTTFISHRNSFGINYNMLQLHPRASGNMVNHYNILRSVQSSKIDRQMSVRPECNQFARFHQCARLRTISTKKMHISKNLRPRLNMCSLAREVIPLRVFMLIYASTLKSTCDVIRAECSGLLASSPSAYLRVLFPQLLSLNSALSTDS